MAAAGSGYVFTRTDSTGTTTGLGSRLGTLRDFSQANLSDRYLLQESSKDRHMALLSVRRAGVRLGSLERRTFIRV